MSEMLGTILGMEMWEDPRGPSLTVRNHTKRDILVRDLGWVIPAEDELEFGGHDYYQAKMSLDLKMFEQRVHEGFPALPGVATECAYCGTKYKETERTNCVNCGAPI